MLPLNGIIIYLAITLITSSFKFYIMKSPLQIQKKSKEILLLCILIAVCTSCTKENMLSPNNSNNSDNQEMVKRVEILNNLQDKKAAYSLLSPRQKEIIWKNKLKSSIN